MAWKWKKTVGFGPFRLNLSTGGWGYSLGVRGFRIGKDAKGRAYTATSLPGTGVYRRDYLSGPTTPQNAGWRGLSPGLKTLLLSVGIALLAYTLLKLLL